MPLVLPVRMVCNVSKEIIHENIRANSARSNDWLYERLAHDRSAIICGSGPSLSECLAEVAERRSSGEVFALNGAAAYLAETVGIADYQVMVDARQQTAELVGPARAHLLASQVHPDCLARAPEAIIWQIALEEIDDHLPANHRERDYTLIGGETSVGISALIIAYVMGYRTLHLYGYDSSYLGSASHAFSQPMNDGEPKCTVMFNGQNYVTSLTMKRQAEEFLTVARLLEAEGVTIHVHGAGLLPDMWNTPPGELGEREKYERMWNFAAYRTVAPGEHVVGEFLTMAQPDAGDHVIDFGCGTGRAGLRMATAGLKPILVDFASNCRDREAMGLPFFQFDLSEGCPLRAPFGFNADMMEHIPPEQVDAVLSNIFACAPRVFLQISTVDDVCGALIGQPLHLSVHPHAWWRERLSQFGRIAHERDDGASSIFYVIRED